MSLNSSNLVLIAQNDPVNAYNQTFPGNPYANTPGVSTTLLLGPDINPNIIESWNREYVSTLFMLSLAKKECLNKTPIWYEEPYLNAPLQVRTLRAPLANATTGSVSYVIDITDASIPLVTVGDKLTLGSGTTTDVIVTAINAVLGAATITVDSFFGFALPGLAVGDLIVNAGNQRADAKGTVDSVYTGQAVQFDNTMEDMGDFAVRWDPQQKLIWQHTGQTDFMARQLKGVYDKYMSSIMQRIWMSTGGTVELPNGMRSMSTKGLLRQQADAGVTSVAVTPGNALDVMGELIFDMQLSGSDDVVVAGTGRTLYKLGLGERSERLRYAIGDKTFNMNMTRYEYWGHGVTPLRMDQWEDRGMYGDSMANELVIFRKSDIKLAYLKGWPMMSMQYKMANRQNSGDKYPGVFDADVVWWNALFAPIWEKAAFSGRMTMNP